MGTMMFLAAEEHSLAVELERAAVADFELTAGKVAQN